MKAWKETPCFQLKLYERATFSVKMVSQQVKGLVFGAKPPCIYKTHPRHRRQAVFLIHFFLFWC